MWPARSSQPSSIHHPDRHHLTIYKSVTAEATGSKPVTPTSTNAFPGLRCGAYCQQIASKPQTVVDVVLKVLSRFGDLADFRARWGEDQLAQW